MRPEAIALGCPAYLGNYQFWDDILLDFRANIYICFRLMTKNALGWVGEDLSFYVGRFTMMIFCFFGVVFFVFGVGFLGLVCAMDGVIWR
jgi:hypothetical protein